MQLKVDTFDAFNIRKETPDGTLFVILNEDRKTGKLVHIQLIIGKAGSNLAAWTYSLAAIINLALSKGATLEEVITLISNTNSDRLVYDQTTPIRSGPAGVAQALITYNKYKAEQVEKELAKIRPKKHARLWGRSARG